MSKAKRIRRERAEREAAERQVEDGTDFGPAPREISTQQARVRARVRRLAAVPGSGLWTTRLVREIKRGARFGR